MPIEKRHPKIRVPASVPDPGDPERKRVLNVLAQRRYRQRRREKIAALEAQAQGLTPPDSGHASHAEVTDLHSHNSSETSSQPNSDECEDIEQIERNGEDIGFPMLDFDQEPLDFNLFQDFDLSTLPTPLPSTPSPPSSPLLLTHPPSNLPIQPLTFPLTPDGGLLTIPHLSAIRAFSTIATALNIISHIYNPTYLHVLSPLPATSPLPANLHPVTAQLTIPHHPILDTLPWPSVREKLICMLALPSALRPPIAREDEGAEGDGMGGLGQAKAIMQIILDLDDFKDGVRVSGLGVGLGEGNELVEESWEVGEVFYRKWWWCLDSRVVECSNRKRRERGVGMLRIGD